jgi:hypothetical protein
MPTTTKREENVTWVVNHDIVFAGVVSALPAFHSSAKSGHDLVMKHAQWRQINAVRRGDHSAVQQV